MITSDNFTHFANLPKIIKSENFKHFTNLPKFIKSANLKHYLNLSQIIKLYNYLHFTDLIKVIIYLDILIVYTCKILVLIYFVDKLIGTENHVVKILFL